MALDDRPSPAWSGSEPSPSSRETSTPTSSASVSFNDLDMDAASTTATQSSSRPKNRRRGLSMPAITNGGSAPGLLSYLPTGYALSSLQALDLDLPTLPPHLTYTSLRSSLLAHITELERRVLNYYGDQAKADAYDGDWQADTNMVDLNDEADDEEDEVNNLTKSRLQAEDESDDPNSPSPRTSYFPRRNRNRSASTTSLTPDALLSQLSLLRTEVLTYLPHLPLFSALSSHLPTPISPFPPRLDFLSSLPSRLDHLHSSVKKIPLPSSKGFSMSSRLPDFSLAPNTSLGMGAQQVFDLLDAILPREGEGSVNGDDEDEDGEGMMFPVFPNRTPRRWKSFDTRRTRTFERTTTSTTDGETTDEDLALLSAHGGGGKLRRVISREKKIGPDGQVTEVEVLEEVVESQSIEGAVKLAREAEGGLIKFVDLPYLWQNNEFIVGSYRFIPIEDWQKLVRSLFAVHNETINIHSHLLSSILVLFSIPFFTYSTPFTSDTPPATFDTVVLLFFLLAAFKCLFCSSLWHLFAGCATKRYFLTFACVDYLGISWLIAASVNSVVYFGFYHHPKAMAVYGTLNLMVGVAGSILPFQQWFNRRHNKHLRISFFLGMGFSALAPIAHMALLNSLQKTLTFLGPMAPSLCSYFFGLWFYANHYPESSFPGMFDLLGASHQIWHISILAAIAFHFRGVMQLYGNKDVYSPASATVFSTQPGSIRTWMGLDYYS